MGQEDEEEAMAGETMKTKEVRSSRLNRTMNSIGYGAYSVGTLMLPYE